MPIETFNISFESTQNKQQYGTKITEGMKKKWLKILLYCCLRGEGVALKSPLIYMLDYVVVTTVLRAAALN